MMKKAVVQIMILLIAIPVIAQKKQDAELKREVTLYNPYKPSLPDVVKKSYLPDMTDTSKVRPDFKYDIKTIAFMPVYNITTIKPATLLPDALPKLYNSFVKFGFGNYVSPLAEISITNERSKKGAIGLYARHFSTHGNVELQNLKKAYAGYMDNDVSVFGRRFLENSVFVSSVDLIQKTRYAYGYDTTFSDYEPSKKDISLNYYNFGAQAGLVSQKLDSSTLSYDFKIDYNFFHSDVNFYQHNLGLKLSMNKSFMGFYVGSGIEYDYYKPSDSASVNSKYIFALTPFVRKSSAEWNLRLGVQLVADKEPEGSSKFHIYPDCNFSFGIVPTYISFFAGLTGKLENNQPLNVIGINPYVTPGKTIYNISNTDYTLIVRTGLTGATGIDGTYQVSASYSVANDMLFFYNSILRDGVAVIQRGNYFMPLYDQAEILNFHGEMGGKISSRFSLNAGADYYKYTLANNDFAWNKPEWTANLGLKYNLRDKIIANISLNAVGLRRELVTTTDISMLNTPVNQIINIPGNLSVNLGAEYRYTKILSFWFKLNNITFSRYYEWAFYPSQRFIGLIGFTYSL